MKQNYINSLLLILFSLSVFAGPGKDSLAVKERNLPKQASGMSPMSIKRLEAFKTTASRKQDTPVTVKTPAEARSFPGLDARPSVPANNPFNGRAEFTEDYLKSVLKVDNKTEEIINRAKELFEQITRHGKFIDIIRGDELLEFPVGIKKDVTQNSSITIGIINAKLHPAYAEVDLFARLTLGELNAELFFGASGVKLSHKGGIYEEARLNLLADFPVGQNGGQWLFTFKGGMDKNGSPDEQTYITIDCEGTVKEIALAADVRIAKTVAVPLNEDGSKKYPGNTTPQNGENPVGNDSYVGAGLKMVTNTVDDLLIDIDLPSFELVSLPGWGFELSNVVLDLSDAKNSPEVQFPDIYKEQQLLTPGKETLWRGFYGEEVRITLPPQFRKKNSDKRITVGARGMLIDNFGVSGNFFAYNVLHLNEGEASKWQFSVDSLHVDLQVNHFMEAGFNGKIVLPVSESDSTGNGALKYQGLIAPNDRYSLRVDVEEDVDFSIFRSKAKLFRESYIRMEVDNGRFHPEANLTGVMAFNRKQNEQVEGMASGNQDIDDLESLEFDGLAFQNFRIQTRTRPYLHIEYMGFRDSVSLPRFYGFELGFHNIAVRTDENDRAELGLNSYINLDDSGIRGDVRLRIIGKLSEGDYLKWKYDGTEVDSVEVDVKRKSFEFQGKLHFFRNHDKYGRGLAGKLRLYSESLKVEMEAKGIFGNQDDFRYWFVDAYGRPLSSGNKNFTIHDIGGGVYHHMRKAGVDERSGSMSGIYYLPDKTTEFGYKALAAFEVKKAAAFTGLIAIEMSFNSPSHGGGVSRVGFYGAGALMKSGSYSGGSAPFGTVGEMQQTVAAKEQSLGNFHELSIDKEGIKYFATEVFPDLLTGEEMFAAQVAIDFDFRNETYWGMFDVFLNLGKIKGDGEKNRLGYLEFYNAPDDWYIYVGTPTKRFGIKGIPIGPVDARINLYYMTGTILPPPAQPPANVIDILNLKGDELLFGRNFSNELAVGQGYAFGAQFAIGKEFDWGIIYASVEAGVGFDLMMRNFGDAHCKGSSGRIGMDGWYATGQLYAYLQGEIGAQIKVFGFRKRVAILKAGVAVLAQGQLPNPWFIRGYAGVKVRVLGVVTIQARLKVTIGEECEIVGKTGLQDVVIISDMSPEDGMSNVDVFDAVQVAFNVPVGETVKVEEATGTKTYRVQLDEILVKEGSHTLKGELIWNNTKDLLTFESNDVLPPERDIVATVKVSFEESVGGQWKTVLENGRPIVEEKEVKFTTGKAPTNIPYSNIENMYPVVDQRYMLPKESNKGFVQLKKGQDYLFGNGLKDELFFISETGEVQKADFTYDNNANRLSFSIPGLGNEQGITYQLVTSKPNDGGEGPGTEEVFTDVGEDVAISGKKITGSSTTDASLTRLEFHFTTSRYNTFKAKINAVKVTNYFTFIDAVDGVYASDIGGMGLQTEPMEPFDVNEVRGTQYTRNEPFIKGVGVPSDTYYKNEIYPLLYKEYPLDGDIRVNRDESVLGMPPLRSVFVAHAYKTLSHDHPEHAFLKENFPFRWHLARSFKQDFVQLQYMIVNRYLNTSSIDMDAYNRYEYIINGVFPYINVETYKVELEYVLPGKESGNKATVKYKNYF